MSRLRSKEDRRRIKHSAAARNITEIRPGGELMFINSVGDPIEVIVVESPDGLPYLVNERFMAIQDDVTNVPVETIHRAGFVGYSASTESSPGAVIAPGLLSCGMPTRPAIRPVALRRNVLERHAE